MNTTMSIEDRCIEVLQNEDLTADEVAAKIGEHLLAVRPSITNLKTSGLLIRTGEKRKNKVSGKYAHVLTIKSSVKPQTPRPINPVTLAMVDQAKRLGYTRTEVAQLLTEQPADDLSKAIEQIFVTVP